ncbi:MAG: flagellar assembly protein FliW [Methylophagaceae bacterium]
MKIHTLDFGTQTIDADDIISFPEGFLGFAEQKEFKLFHEDNDNPTVHSLQSITDEGFSMSLVAPSTFGIDYEIALTDQEQSLLNLENTNDVVVALIVYKQHNGEAATDMKVVVKAPVIINIKDKLGMQKTLDFIEVRNLAA